MTVFNRLAATGILVAIASSSLVFFPLAVVIWLITRPFDRRLRLLHLFTCLWAYMYVWMVPAWKVRRLGRMNIDPRRTYLVVSNHQSQLDILVAFGLFFHFKWVSKAEMFKVPLIGWNMALNGYLKLVRGHKESIRKMMDDCTRTLKQGSSVFIFPEGSRSPDGRVREFKAGAFVLAKRLKLPVLPIAISGTAQALPKHSMNFHGRHHIRVEVLKAITPQDAAGLSVTELAEKARRLIAARVLPEPAES